MHDVPPSGSPSSQDRALDDEPQASSQGLAGRLAARFQQHALTPLLALVVLLLGLFAALVTPREEEPQIDVAMANVLIGFPGAAAADVQALVARPAERVLAQMAGVEHTQSVSHPGLAVLTVQFKVGVPRQEALVKLAEVIDANADWLPRNLGVLPPLVKPKGIDDVPVLALSLWSRDDRPAHELERVARTLEAELQRVHGVRELATLGGPGQAVMVQLQPTRLRERGLDLLGLAGALRSANHALPAGSVAEAGGLLQVHTDGLLRSADEVAQLVVGLHQGRPVYLREVATVEAGPAQPSAQVWFTPGGAAAQAERGGHPAVTLTLTKKPGANAADVTRDARTLLEQLRPALVPEGVELTVVRDYGASAAEKARQLITKLTFATASVIVLVGLALGRREAVVVGLAVVLTLTATLFASWAWGFTLNRVSLFALIFSIGILVDDTIVVVENIHRHQAMAPGRSLAQIIPAAVDEVGGPTILATLTVIAALLPMAFVSGLMGPYMSPIPINASLGMAISLLVAFTVTPWLALRLMRAQPYGAGAGPAGGPGRLAVALQGFFRAALLPLLNSARKRWLLLAGIVAAMGLSLALALVPSSRLGVVLKMLPFDNKSEWALVVDLPAGTAVEDTAATLHALAEHLARQPEVLHLQGYAGTASPITFNGLVRQYFLRAEPHQGELQVNLVPRQQRQGQSHALAQRLRPALQAIADRHGAKLKLVEVPPGPPVLSPIVAEVYGPDEAGRQQLAARLEQAFRATPDITAVDSSLSAEAPRAVLRLHRQRAHALGVSAETVAQTVAGALSGLTATHLLDGHSSRAVPLRLQLPRADQAGLDALLALPLRTASGTLVPLSELVQVERGVIDPPLFTKDQLGLSLVVGDVGTAPDRAAQATPDSPLYGLFGIRSQLGAAAVPGTGVVAEHWISRPANPYAAYAVKWDGEWQITYETFRDMGTAYGVGLVLIYLLVVAQFRSYVTPLVIMAPIPLTLVGVMPGHALLGASFTATSMIGMIALAGIIVRNSILLVDFIELQVAQGRPWREAVVAAAAVRAQPILLTALAAMTGAVFILDDPIFNGLAISLLFGIGVSTLLTLVVIPVLHAAVHRRRFESLATTPLDKATP